MSNDLLSHRFESDGLLIFDTKTDRDICRCSTEKDRDWLLDMVNKIGIVFYEAQ